MKTILKSVMLVLAAGAAAYAQVDPAAIGGPGRLPVSSNLQYAVRYSQNAYFSNYYPTEQTSTASGSLNYVNRSRRLPFHADYSGGYVWALSGPGYQTGLFQRLFLRQGFTTSRSKFEIRDDVSYVPESPSIGFSGVPGTGEPIGVPNPDPSTSQTILTVSTHSVDNIVGGSVEHLIGNATTVRADGSSEILRYMAGGALDGNTLQGDGRIERRLTARNSIYAGYTYSDFNYPGLTASFDTSTVMPGFRRKWTRNLTTEAGVGPEWVASTNSSVVPKTTNLSAAAQILYDKGPTLMSGSFIRGTNGGSGYLIGGEVDWFEGTFSHTFGRNMTIGLSGGYERTLGLSNSDSGANASFGGAESTWRVGRNMIVFANYSATNQGVVGTLPSSVANEMRQIIGFGFGFSPPEAHAR